jgi:hypothetical protein
MIAAMPDLRTRRLWVLPQDPGVRRNGQILTAQVAIPYEDVEPGPIGHRVQVVDYDSSTQTLYKPAPLADADGRAPRNAEILDDPAFHAQNAYALVMRTLARFEQALGRRVSWGFRAHQLKVIPHAFEEMNAFYSREAESLLFGYYRGANGLTFMSLSQDIVVHETSHALLDGLRSRFMDPSSADQAAFHEAFADIVALLSVFSFGEVLRELLERDVRDGDDDTPAGLIRTDRTSMAALMRSVLLGLADEMKAEAGLGRIGALRRSVEIEPDPAILTRDDDFQEAHRRGEVLVAAVMRAFVSAWTRRLASLGTIQRRYLDLGRVAEEGATIAELMLTMAIRALDYTPPIHLSFGDYLSAMITADTEIRSSDSRYGLRSELLDWFGRYGITPASETADGLWERTDLELGHDGVRFGSLQTDAIEMFRLVWANRRALHFDPTAYTQVASVRPCTRVSPEDGFFLRETVAECVQYVSIRASELSRYGLKKPAGLDGDTQVDLLGGSTLVLDEYGTLKFEIHNRLPSRSGDVLDRAQTRLNYLWSHGFFNNRGSARLATIHRLRAGQALPQRDEVW